MTPAARSALANATMAASMLPVRVTGPLARAAHKARTDDERIRYLEEARRALMGILATVQLAELALKRERREVES
jgi:hypothetical protein